MLSTNTAKAINSDSQRAAFARWLTSASTSPPPIIGSQITRLRRGPFDTCSVPFASAPVSDEGGQEPDQAEDHHEGVVVEESGLGAPQPARAPVDAARAAVQAVHIDHFFGIAARPPAHPPASCGQALDPQLDTPVI